MTLMTNFQSAALAVVLVMSTSAAVHAQNSPSPADSPQQRHDSGGETAARVKRALHSDPTLLDKHIEISMDQGNVLMTGFVDSAGDMEKAVKAANKAAGSTKVINKLTIKRSDSVNSDNSNG